MSGYAQTDPRWSGDKLGLSTYWTMGMAGCLVTAGANVLRAFGHDITPGDLNRLATSEGLINANGDVVRHDWLAVLFPDVLRYVERRDWGNQPADLHYFDIRNDLNTEIILQIDDSPAAGMQTHFMRVVGWDGGIDVIVDDSWDAVRKGVSKYGTRWNPDRAAKDIIYTADKYVKVQPPAPAGPAMVTLAQVTQLYQDNLHRSPDQSGIDHYVGHYTYEFVQNDIRNSAEYAALNAPKPTPEPIPAAPTPEPAIVPAADVSVEPPAAPESTQKPPADPVTSPTASHQTILVSTPLSSTKPNGQNWLLNLISILVALFGRNKKQ